ncbi:MAG: adenosylcobalamin-dependent ribonucleoside-diphosphate reductase [Candidatus Woesearchaeota archaeon]|nr:adenosylcobalamin-dependent ribonucleoside-diphosphate reductase [Candidatus Woesearchaeota archaeon]
MALTKVRKRDGRVVDFSPEKIAEAIFNAAESVGGKDHTLAEQLAQHAVQHLTQKHKENSIPTVEEVQDAVEIALIETGHATTVKAFILYRQKRREEREAKSNILSGKLDQTKIDLNGLKLLEKRYLAKDAAGSVTETPAEMFQRVAKAVAAADKKYGKTSDDVKKCAESFYEAMKNLEFLPSTPLLMNAGTKLQQLYSCFVIGIDDSIESIFEAVKEAAIIHHAGGGTGFSFSRLRPQGDSISSSTGASTGPLSFMTIFDAATEHVKRGGKRRGANMGILRVDHPDILEFINFKADGVTMTNFNLSVGLTNKFMRAVKSDWDIELINPRTNEPVKKVSSKSLFDSILAMAWKRGDPGIVFIDLLNEKNPTPSAGAIESTSPCADQPLLPFEGAVLGSINLTTIIREPVDDESDKEKEKEKEKDKDKDKEADRIDWLKLRALAHLAVHFLDNAIDVNQFTSARIKEATLKTRKIGIGVMGFADLLFHLDIPYNSDEGVALGEKVMKFIRDEARAASAQLAAERGVFPLWPESIYAEQKMKLRNASLTCVSPTGSISLIAGVSPSLEPHFALCYQTLVLETELVKVNKVLEAKLRTDQLYTPLLISEIAKKGIQTVDLPRKYKKVFITAPEVPPEYHLKMQAAFQKHCDGGVSKTINFPRDCSIEDVRTAYMLAWELNCNGITIYRDTSLSHQVMEKLS